MASSLSPAVLPELPEVRPHPVPGTTGSSRLGRGLLDRRGRRCTRRSTVRSRRTSHSCPLCRMAGHPGKSAGAHRDAGNGDRAAKHRCHKHQRELRCRGFGSQVSANKSCSTLVSPTCFRRVVEKKKKKKRDAYHRQPSKTII